MRGSLTVGYEPDTRKQIVRTIYGKTLSEVQEKLTQTKLTAKYIDWNRAGLYTAGFTLDTYTHVTDKMQQEAAEKMGGFMEMVM